MIIMEIAVCGKTNVGKTSFFSAATLVDAEISNRVFTTIKPNRGVAFVRAVCPCKELKVKCNPQNSKCVNSTRLIPVKLIDIAGLVPDAHLGRGLGNQFLSDIMEADAIIHVVDISGSTDSNGNQVPPGTHSPESDILFFQEEIELWLLDVLKRGFTKHADFTAMVQKQLSGLKVNFQLIEDLIKGVNLKPDSSDEEFRRFLRLLMEESKPALIAGNKIDIEGANGIYQSLKEKYNIVPCSAQAELALRKAAKIGAINYMPGEASFEIVQNIDEKQMKALEFITSHVLSVCGSTGVQKAINKAVFDLLDMIVVYPVENEHKFSNKQGDVLPDALLIRNGSTALDLAYKVHEDIGKKFISAVDARTKKAVASDYKLKNGDIISIKSGR